MPPSSPKKNVICTEEEILDRMNAGWILVRHGPQQDPSKPRSRKPTYWLIKPGGFSEDYEQLPVTAKVVDRMCDEQVVREIEAKSTPTSGRFERVDQRQVADSRSPGEAK